MNHIKKTITKNIYTVTTPKIHSKLNYTQNNTFITVQNVGCDMPCGGDMPQAFGTRNSYTPSVALCRDAILC